MTTMLDEVMAYIGASTSVLQKGESTAGGDTDDKTPDQPGQSAAVASMATDARKIANTVFGGGTLKIPAEVMVMGDMYDITQAQTRLTKLYNFSREDFYRQATESLEPRKTRLAYKQALIMGVIKDVETPRDAQTME